MNTLRLLPQPDLTFDRLDESPGTGVLVSERGNLPLVAMSVTARITGLLAATTMVQTFHNPHDCPIEATYIFPLPDRAAVTGFTLTVGCRRVAGVLQERQAARTAYDDAVAAGQRAAILEEDRPDVFTTRVANLPPGEQATIELSLAGPVPFEMEEATFRVPLVVAPRYIPGRPLDGTGAGAGTGFDTDVVPDGSRITPPVLLPGSANPVRLAIRVHLDPAGLPLGDVCSSLHAVVVAGELPGPLTVELQPGGRLDRDFILRYRIPGCDEPQMTALAIPDAIDSGDGSDGTFVVTVLPPISPRASVARDVVVLLDRSGSMGGWKMVAARRAAARIIDSLSNEDRFAVVAFDDRLECPPGQQIDALVEATDRNRYQAVQWLSLLEARGGTEMAAALAAAQSAWARAGAGIGAGAGTGAGAGAGAGARAQCCVLVTDGQVADEDRLVGLATAIGVRTYAVGIDRAVNGGLLRRLAAVTGGRCELVESEDRLDRVLTDLQRRIGQPQRESVSVRFEGLAAVPPTITPTRPADLYSGVPLVVSGRYQGAPGGRAVVTWADPDSTGLSCDLAAASTPAASVLWARAHLRDLEDRYAALPRSFVGTGDREALAARIVAVSLRFHVLCRFTAWVAIDDAGDPVAGLLHRIVQPVEMPSGWSAAAAPAHAGPVSLMAGYGGSADVSTPPMAPFQPQAAPAAQGGRPPVGMVRSPGSPEPARGSEALAPSVSLAPYHARLSELLDAVDRLPAEAPGPAQRLPTEAPGAAQRLPAEAPGPAQRLPAEAPGAARRLAADAKLLAGDIASVADKSVLVEQLEALAAALLDGQGESIKAAVQQLRNLLLLMLNDGRADSDRARHRFWR